MNASRLVRKNLYRPEVFNGSTGLTHRGGPLLEDFKGMNGVTVLPTNATCDAQTCLPATVGQMLQTTGTTAGQVLSVPAGPAVTATFSWP